MHSRYKKKSLVGLGVGLTLFLGGLALIFASVRGSSASFGSVAGLGAILMIVISIPFYLWGCVALAKAKGYSTAIVLTCILGWLFPVVVLLALPDNNKHHRRW